MKKKAYTVSLLVNNKPDVLSRVSGTLGGRGYNIESLCVNTTMDPEISKIVLTTISNKTSVIQIKKQLDKLVDVRKTSVLTNGNATEREMALIKMNVTEENISEIRKAIDTLKCRIVFMGANCCILEATGRQDEIETALNYLKPMGIEDIARTGTIALGRK
ncbi:MAG: acetolactate synthase small subunit [Proteobacteria bacterium]|nr:acetolactate synthase small subunit [Pseudomonadota bacterium]